MDANDAIDAAQITELSKPQRRVLGVLLEKSFTTPEYYPLTIKAATTGCNQKSNRDPVTNYDEEDVADALDGLRELQLAGVVHTESGRTERYRHYARKRFDFSEPQLAIVTELLLRGRQTLGELRSRASRMVSIESLNQLRDELRGLLERNYVQASGPLERRGVEVDHNLYPADERQKMGAGTGQPAAAAVATNDPGDEHIELPHPPPGTVPAPSEEARTLSALHHATDRLEAENQELRSRLQSLAAQVESMSRQLDELRQRLGG